MDSDASDREPSNPSTQDLQDEQREQLESSLPVPDQPSEPLSDFALQLIHHKDDPALITISQAERIQESLSKTYMVYPITVALADQVYTAKRRYSEFESLWTLMVKSHPAVLVPPIPQKHSIGDLTIKNGKDSGKKRVEERERLLKAFLVRSIKHPALVLFKPMHLFMMGKQSWHEILQTSGLAHLLVKRPKLAKSMGNLRKPDAQFQGALDFTGRFTAQVQYMQKSVKKIADHYKVLNKASSELGMHYNSWSLSEEELQAPIEGAGQAFDTCAGLAGELERSVNVDLGEQLYEFGLYATSIERLLDSRNKKHYEFESTSEQLIQKQVTLLI